MGSASNPAREGASAKARTSVDVAAAYARRLVSEQLDLLGVSEEDATDGLDLRVNAAGSLDAVRTRERLETAGGYVHDVVTTNLATTGDPTRPLDERSVDALMREIRRHARRILRARSIAETRGRGVHGEDRPAWSFTLHRLALAWLRHAGVDPVLAVRDDGGAAHGAFSYMALEASLAVGRTRVQDGRLDFSSLGDAGSLQYVGSGRPCAVIARDVPETLAATMAGRLLSEAVDHPVVRRAGSIRIREAHASQGLLTLVLEDRHDFLRRPPVGADRRWNRIAFDPRPGD